MNNDQDKKIRFEYVKDMLSNIRNLAKSIGTLETDKGNMIPEQMSNEEIIRIFIAYKTYLKTFFEFVEKRMAEINKV